MPGFVSMLNEPSIGVWIFVEGCHVFAETYEEPEEGISSMLQAGGRPYTDPGSILWVVEPGFFFGAQ